MKAFLVIVCLLISAPAMAGGWAWEFKYIDVCKELAKGTPFENCDCARDCLSPAVRMKKVNEIMREHKGWDWHELFYPRNCDLTIKRKVQME